MSFCINYYSRDYHNKTLVFGVYKSILNNNRHVRCGLDWFVCAHHHFHYTNAVALPEPERTDTSEQALLPTHYLFTQRWLWGANGLMRNFDTFALSLEAREREIEIREKMNQVHRIAGYVSLAGMIGSGITGQMSSKGNEKAKDLHETFTGVTNFTYFGSLAFALFAPPRVKNHASGFTKTNIHRTLSIVHVTSMLATNILSGMLENNSSLVPYHRIAAITAFSSLFVATVVIKL